jgi:hypothetical protein
LFINGDYDVNIIQRLDMISYYMFGQEIIIRAGSAWETLEIPINSVQIYEAIINDSDSDLNYLAWYPDTDSVIPEPDPEPDPDPEPEPEPDTLERASQFILRAYWTYTSNLYKYQFLYRTWDESTGWSSEWHALPAIPVGSWGANLSILINFPLPLNGLGNFIPSVESTSNLETLKFAEYLVTFPQLVIGRDDPAMLFELENDGRPSSQIDYPTYGEYPVQQAFTDIVASLAEPLQDSMTNSEWDSWAFYDVVRTSNPTT